MARLLVAVDQAAGVNPQDVAAAWDDDDEARAAGLASVEVPPPGQFLGEVATLVVIPLAVNMASTTACALVSRLMQDCGRRRRARVTWSSWRQRGTTATGSFWSGLTGTGGNGDGGWAGDGGPAQWTGQPAWEAFRVRVSFGDAAEYDVTVTDPAGQDAEGRLAWYFEQHLRYPFLDKDLEHERCSRSPPTGRPCSRRCSAGQASHAYRALRDRAFDGCRIEVSGSAALHRLHWEAAQRPGPARAAGGAAAGHPPGRCPGFEVRPARGPRRR